MPPPRRPLTGPATSARRRSLPTSSPNCSVRTLTIGVLIVTTGTLAALPFRNPPTGDPGEQPTRSPVSGPSTDLVADNWPDHRSENVLEPDPALEPDPWRPSAEHPSASATSPRPSDRFTADRTGAAASRRSGRERGPERLAGKSPGNDTFSDSDPSDQTIKAEASYEDWMIPVDDSQLIRERFSATVSGLDPDGSEPDDGESMRERQAGNGPPPSTDALPASLREARRPPSRRPPEGPAPPTAERHWIRQPR